MKRNLLLMTTFIASFWVSGQNIFERYADNDKVTFISISPKMFEMLGQMSLSMDDPEAQEYMEMVTSINNFKVLFSSSKDISNDMLKWVNDQVLKENLEKLMSIKDKDADVTFYVKEGKNEAYVEKLLMYVNEIIKPDSKKPNFNFNGREINAVLMLIEGNIDLNKISKLTDQMDLPGGNQLRKAQQNNDYK